LNEYWFKPRHVLATVDGVDIQRQDYWKYRAVELADQANQYASIAQSPFVDDSQKQQYITLAQQTSAQIDGVWGTIDLEDATLQKMIDDQVYLQSLDEFGVTISDEDVQNHIGLQFDDPNAPIYTPTPSPTLIPERAEWATQTAVPVAQGDASPTPEASSPIASPNSVISPSGSPVSGVTPVASPANFDIEPAMSPGVPLSPESSSPIASPIPEVADSSQSSASRVAASPESSTPIVEPSPTPNEDQARQTATANFENYEDALFDKAHMSRSDYVNLIVRPAIAHERIDAQLTANVGQRAEQVHAAHILVDTKDLADAMYSDVTQGGVDFAQAAKDQSIDSATAPNGGDLGWFTRGQMVDAFENAAFSTAPGQISPPVETEFGWHIIKVFAHESDRAMTDDQISQLHTSLVEDWLTGRKSELDIDSEIEPTATSAAPANFVPPPNAPPVPTPTEVAVNASPLASPASETELPATDSGSPTSIPASTVALPMPTPVASPAT